MKFTADQNRILEETKHLSIAESAGISGRTQDAVRYWRKKRGYLKRYNKPRRYVLRVGETVVHYQLTGMRSGDSLEKEGVIQAIDGDSYLVEFADRTRQWCPENNLHTLPSEAEIAARCAEARAKWDDTTWAKYRPRAYEIPEVAPYAVLD